MVQPWCDYGVPVLCFGVRHLGKAKRDGEEMHWMQLKTQVHVNRTVATLYTESLRPEMLPAAATMVEAGPSRRNRRGFGPGA